MTPEETGKLLATCAAYDRRTVGEMDVIAWFKALGDLPYDVCDAAAVAHYRHSRDWIMPADIRAAIKRAQPIGEDLRTLLDPAAYRAHIDAVDAAFLSKLQRRAGKPLALKAPDSDTAGHHHE